MANHEGTDVKLIDPPAVFKSKVWKHYCLKATKNHQGIYQADKSEIAVCKECNAEVKYSGNTTNLTLHLSRHHPYTSGAAEPPAVQKPAGPSQTKLDMKLKADSKRSVSITSGILNFIVKDLRPFSVVENEGFRDLIRVLEPRYTIPSRQHFSDNLIPKIYNATKLKLIDELADVEFVSITSDGWTSRSTQSYETVTCHYINKDWELQNKVLQTRIMTESHTGEHIAAMLENCLKEWHINGKTGVLVTDNASNMNTAAKLTSIPVHLKCFAHTLNLASQKAMKVDKISRVLVKIRRIVAFFHRSSSASELLKSKQLLIGLPSHKLKMDVSTRWNSSYEMVERFLEQQAAIQATLLTQEMRKQASVLPDLMANDIAMAEHVVNIMKEMKTATVVMCEEKIPTVSIISPLFNKLTVTFSQTSKAVTDNIAKAMLDAMATDLSKRYMDSAEFLRKSSALDPRFKTLPYLADVERQSIFSTLTEEASQATLLFDKVIKIK